ncbi:MAG: DUF1178 family protein [Rhodospirillales bacterium]|nr:DUF1178 family protein [Rhodospirillales bacterium]
MILYQLKCSNAHEFEGWFRDGATYDTQSAKGEIECPICGDGGVDKAPMAPKLNSSRGENSEQRAQQVARKVLSDLDMLRRKVEDNFEDVGDKFAEEARSIHHGEAEERGIYGEATKQEVEELVEEEIEIQRIPWKRRKDS